MKIKYERPYSQIVFLKDSLCETGLTSASVQDHTGKNTIDHFGVNENQNPNGNDDNWFDNPDNWGGD